MHDYFAMLVDTPLDHWVDIVVAAFIAILGYLGRDRLRSMDARHQRAEDKFEEHDDQIASLQKDVAVLQTEQREH